MLTTNDLLEITKTRQQITLNRTTSATLLYEIALNVDEWTGEVETDLVEVDVSAVVTEITADTEYGVEQNITRDRSRIQVSVALDQVEGHEMERPTFIIFRGATYAVLTVDWEGIGDTPNRLEIIARKVA